MRWDAGWARIDGLDRRKQIIPLHRKRQGRIRPLPL